MAPSRKSRSVNKRFSYVNNISPNKSRENGNTSRQRKRKLADMLGPQWKKEELERFYKAYRKHGKDWEKVAAMVHNRSVEMIEALYTMNRAYLSLPKGYSSAAGLIAMMTDHYANMEEDSNSEQETNEGIGVSRKPQKRTRGAEAVDGPSVADLLNSQLTESSYSCLSLLKKRRSVSRPWAVGKRTPRVPVSYAVDKVDGEKYVSPIRQSLKAKVDALDDDVTHKLALALTEASKGSRSLKVSQAPKLKAKTQSPRQNGARMHAGSVMTSAKLHGSLMDDGGCELPLGSTEADIGGHSGDRRALKGKKHLRKKPNEEERIDKEESIDNDLADAKEACSGTEEGEKVSAVKGNFDMEIGNKKLASSSNKSTRKKSKKVLFGQGEDPAFDALQTLADLSLRLPETPVDTESSVHAGEGKARIVAKSKVKGSHSPPGVKTTSIKTSKRGKASPHDRNTTPEAKDGTHQINDGIRKQRQKSLPFKISENDELTGTLLGDSQKSERKLLKRPERTSSSDHVRELNDSAPATLKVTSPNKLNLTTKVRSRRKFSTPEPLMAKDIKSVETIGNGHFNDRALSIKEKLSNCLSCYQVRRWCVFEWFYSAIDYPWFAKKEFVEYLNHVGLGHISRLTRVEWGVIRSSLGKPRRFSEQFLKEERGKLNQYRDSVRQHYGELRAGTREGLPTDLARPLYVGQQVIALHPKTREIHDGSILTIDHSKARVQFDQSELGVEFIMDVDCMPSNPLENMPASLTEHTLTSTKIIDDLNEPKMNGQPMERKVDGYTKFASTENLENINARLQIAPSTYHVGNLLHQTKGDLSSSDTQNNIDVGKAVNAQQALNGPSVLAQIQAKEADIHALSELTRALDKKEALLAELTRLNDEVLGNQRDGENSLKDSELFKKYYAAVLLQLNEINEQVSSALFCLRQRNTYQGNSPLMWFKPMGSVVEPVGHCRSFGYSRDDSDIQETGCHVAEIVETSRTKARTMVDVAVQAMSSFKKEDSSMESIEEVIDFVNNHLSADELSMPAKRSPTTASRANNAPASEDQLSPCTNPGTINDPVDAKLNNLFDQNNTKMPLDLIGQCVATLLMIQKCTERQFPPSDVAQVLDSAVTSLKPCCPQNLPIYAEIQKCIGIIRNQILALIPA